MFALGDPGRAGFLAAALNQADPPYLADILQPGDNLVDLAVVRDLGAGATSYLTVKALGATELVGPVVDHFSQAFRRYVNRPARPVRSTSFIPRSTTSLPPPHNGTR